MSSTYGVVTHNAFDLLRDDDDDDPEALVAHRAALEHDVSGPKTAEPTSGKQAPREEGRAGHAREHRGESGTRGPMARAARSSDGRGRGGGGRGYEREPTQEEDTEEDAGFDTGYGMTPSSRSMGRGGRSSGRHGSRGRGAGLRGSRREFDRRDGTGRGHEPEKRGGAGKGNWGQPLEDPTGWGEEPVKSTFGEENYGTKAHQNGDTKDENGAAEVAEDADKTPEGENGEQKKEKEEEKETLTLKEYEEKIKAKALTNVVERPEVDMGQFEGLTVYERTAEDTGLKTLEQAKPRRTKSKGKKEGRKEVIPTSFRVGEPMRRGGRGGRGSGRSGPGGRFDRDDRTGSGEDFVSRQESWGDGDDGDSGGHRSYRGGYGGYGGGRGGSGGRGRRGGRRGGYGGTDGYGYENKQDTVDITDTSSFPSLKAS